VCSRGAVRQYLTVPCRRTIASASSVVRCY
jgi:hypothetical protein